MTTVIQAVYEGGVLRPTKPLILPEGQTVDVIISPMNYSAPQPREPTLAEKDYSQRIKSAESLVEMFAVMASAPLAPEDDFDIDKEINESRQLTGFRLPDPESTAETGR